MSLILDSDVLCVLTRIALTLTIIYIYDGAQGQAISA